MRISDWSSDVCSSDLLAAGGVASEALQRLLHVDLDFTLRHAGLRCIGSWEEVGENAHHYYVAVVQLGALVHGRDWIDDGGERSAAEARLRAGLERHWSPHRGVYRSEEHTSELQSLMRISYAVFGLKKNNNKSKTT